MIAPEPTAPGSRDIESMVRRREERALFERLARQRDAGARAALVERFLPLARHLARRFGRPEDMDDLVQIASIGLIKAIDRFDPERGLAFTSFAFPTITGELKRHFRDRSWSVRVPRELQELTLRIERLSVELVNELGRAPTVPELARRADATSEQVLEALQAATAHHAVSLDQPPAQAGAPETAGREIAVQERGFAVVEDAEMLDDLLRILPERDREILMLRFRDDLLQWQIAEIMGISQMHVSRVISSSIDRLRRAAGT